MRITAVAIIVLMLIFPAKAADDKRLVEDCLRGMVESMSILPAEIRFIDVAKVTDPRGEADTDTIREVINDALVGSLRFKLSEEGKTDAVLRCRAQRLRATILNDQGLRLRLSLAATGNQNLLWTEEFSCRHFRRLRLSLGTGATASKAKFCRISFDVFEKTTDGYQLFSSFDTSAEVWPPAAMLRLELCTRSRTLAALVLYGSVSRVNPGGIDGKGGGETPVSLSNGTSVRPIDCDLGGSLAAIMGGQAKLSPARLVGSKRDPFFLSIGAGALYYKLNYTLTLTADYFPAPTGGRSENVSLSGFLPGAVFLFSFDLPVSSHLSAFFDYAQYGETTANVPRGEESGAEMFGYGLTLAKNRLHTFGIRFVY